jgi:hypothetical protein
VGISSTGSIDLPVPGALGSIVGVDVSLCAFVAAPGAPASFSVGGSRGASPGTLPFWDTVFTNSGGAILLVVTAQGVSSAIGEISGAGCTLSTTLAPLPDSPLDSDAAAIAANSAGGSAFLEAHPSANTSMILIGPISSAAGSQPATWLVTYTLCSLAATTGSNAVGFSAEVDALNGSVRATGTGLETCAVQPGGSSGSPPVTGALTIGSPAEAAVGGSYWYNFSVLSADGTLTLGELGFHVESGGGGTVSASSAWTLTIVGFTGAAVASYSLTTGVWTVGASTVASSLQTISLATDTSLSGDVLVAVGMGSYSGAVPTPIP